MQPTLCSRCRKNVAVVFITRMNEKNEVVNEGLCLKCAAQLNLPQVKDMMQRMGITPEDLEDISGEMMQAFGGAEEKVLRLRGTPEPDGFRHLTTGVVDTQALLDAAHAQGVSVSAFLAAVMAESVQRKQAAEKLADIGYRNVYEFGGIIDWTGGIEY